jgi:murein L,D-transpeptidase YafK
MRAMSASPRKPSVNPGLRASLRVCARLLVWLLPCLLPAAAADAQHWLLVDTQARTLHVMRGEQAQMTLHDIAVGRYGTSAEKRRADNTTPLGRFRVTRINGDSDFHRFIGLDYPDLTRAQKAYHDDLIDERQMRAIREAHRRGDAPPQNTPLGGHIGIHGLGSGDLAMHRSFNWTKGCVALTNEQIDALLAWVRPGMPVEIR